MQRFEHVSQEAEQAQGPQRGEQGGPESTIGDREIQAEGHDDLHHLRVRLMLSPQGPCQTSLVALVQPLEVLRDAQLLEGVHVVVQLPDLSKLGYRVPVGRSDVLVPADAEEHGQGAALGVVGHRGLLREHDAQQEDTAGLDVLSQVLRDVLAPPLPRARDHRCALEAETLHRRLPEDVPRPGVAARGGLALVAPLRRPNCQRSGRTGHGGGGAIPELKQGRLRPSEDGWAVLRFPPRVAQPLLDQVVAQLLRRDAVPGTHNVDQGVQAPNAHGSGAAEERICFASSVRVGAQRLAIRPIEQHREVVVHTSDARSRVASREHLVKDRQPRPCQVPPCLHGGDVLLNAFQHDPELAVDVVAPQGRSLSPIFQELEPDLRDGDLLRPQGSSFFQCGCCIPCLPEVLDTEQQVLHVLGLRLAPSGAAATAQGSNIEVVLTET
mmetsp:Transcript_143405/g.458423  ORF Transcript_143405/g.458423 Transcript_143405/m.458423 type:complete len:439 (+) Transcript_143405:966-2282(+)